MSRYLLAMRNYVSYSLDSGYVLAQYWTNSNSFGPYDSFGPSGNGAEVEKLFLIKYNNKRPNA